MTQSVMFALNEITRDFRDGPGTAKNGKKNVFPVFLKNQTILNGFQQRIRFSFFGSFWGADQV